MLVSKPLDSAINFRFFLVLSKLNELMNSRDETFKNYNYRRHRPTGDSPVSIETRLRDGRVGFDVQKVQ